MQRDLESFDLAQHRDHLRQVIAVPAGDTDPVALDRAIHLDLRLIDHLLDLASAVG